MSSQVIMHIVSNPFFVDRGGLVRVYEEVVASQFYYQNIFICSYPGGRDVGDIKTFRIPWIFWYKNKSGGAHDLNRIYLDISLFFYSLFLCFKLKPSIIHTHGITGILSGSVYKFFKKKTILLQDAEGTYANEIISEKKYPGLNKIIAFFEKRFYQLTDFILCSNYILSNTLKNKYRINKPIIDLPDGIGKLPEIKPVNKVSLEINTDLVIGYIGLLKEEQGIDFLIKSIETIVQKRNVTFIVIGHPDEEKYRIYFNKKKLGEKVKFLGAIDYTKIYDYLSIFDIAISPKIFDTVAANGKLLNYMALGLPTLVFGHEVNRYFLDNAALYAEYKNTEDFIEKILLLIDDKKLRTEYSSKILLRSKEFYWENIIKTLLKVYNGEINAEL